MGDILTEDAADGAVFVEVPFGTDHFVAHPDFMGLFREAGRRGFRPAIPDSAQSYSLAPLVRETFVGFKPLGSFPAKETADLAAADVRAVPEIARCSEPTCLRAQTRAPAA